jgi:hypothetical protein
MRRISFTVVALAILGAISAQNGCANGDTAAGNLTATGGAQGQGKGGASASGGTGSATGGATGQGGSGAPATGGSAPPTPGTGGTPATGGTTGAGGTPATGGVPGTGGKPATGGATGAGGTPATGGSPGTGGTPATGGTTGTGGAAATGGSSGFGQPACGNTMAGTAIAKGVMCTAADATAGTATALCYKTCGPEKQGVKSETCPAGGGTYTEMTGCSFDPSKDYSCYKVPATASAQNAMCPTTAIVSGSACSIADCIVCGLSAGYMDSTGAAKTGYCVCQASAASPTWSCASNTAWPCPNGTGC